MVTFACVVAFAPMADENAVAEAPAGGGFADSCGTTAAWLTGTKPAGPSLSDRSAVGALKVASQAAMVGNVTSAPPLQDI